MKKPTSSRGAEKRGLSSDELCSILEASAKAGVTKLLFRDLHVEFGTKSENQVLDLRGLQLPEYPVVQQRRDSAPVGELTEKQHASLKKDALEDEETRLRQERLALALVEDPVMFEQLLRDEELSDDVDSADSDDDL